MVFGKNFRSKMEKIFSPSTRDRGVVDGEALPPYPEELVQAGIQEDSLTVLKDYDTVIIVDDSASMEPLWKQVQLSSCLPPPRSNRSLTQSLLLSVIGVQGVGDARGGCL